MIKKLFSPVHSFLSKVNKNYSSSKLYIPYNQTSDTFVVVEPYMDLEDRLKNIDTLKHNVKLRGLSIDVDKIWAGWADFLNVQDELVGLNTEKQNLTEQFKKIKNKSGAEVDRLKETRSRVMERVRSLRDRISVLETEIVVPSLYIPNSLHPECPLSECKILFQREGLTEIDNKDCLTHVEIGASLDCLNYVNSVMVYLSDEASFCERAALAYFGECLEQANFIPFCNSDLIKTVIAEGCGTDINNADGNFILNENDLRLVGGASLQSFCAFLTKQSVGWNKLPLKLYASGRLYNPSKDNDGLFSATQTNAVNLFIGSADECGAKQQFDEMLAVYRQLYENIGLDHRIVYSPASELNNWESLRAQVELYSVSRRGYVAAASLSLSGNFISKRLRIYWSSKGKRDFIHIVNGKIIDTNILLGCLLEQNVNKLVVPNCLKNYMMSS